jgi:3-hydroxy-9,10-secoandrosta-1,3,5(10)-triene-9,17-dione monooxygenase
VPVTPGRLQVPETDLTPRELLARAEAMVPLLREQQDETEKRTYYSEKTHRQFREAGFYRVLQPRRYGGYEFDLPTFYKLAMILARGCPSTAWCFTLSAAHVVHLAALFPEEVQDAAFGDDGEFRSPLRALPKGSATRRDGGWIIDGTWDFCSGAPYATHFIGTTIVAPYDPKSGTLPELVLFILPRSQWTMLDDWGELIGFRGSGSHSIAVERQPAAAASVLPARLHDVGVSKGSVGLGLHGNPMYAGRYLGFFGGELASVMVGMARAALDEYERVMPTKLTTFPPIVPRHLSRDFQLTLGVALGMIDTAEAAVLQVGQRYMEYCRRGAEGGSPFSREEDLRLHAIVNHAGRLAVEAINLIARKAGSSTATRNGQRLQRYLRDLLTYHTHHESTQFEAHATMLGRVRFGLEMWE